MVKDADKTVKTRKHKILYVGPLVYGGTCLQRMQAFKSLGQEIIELDTYNPEEEHRQKTIVERIIIRLFGPKDRIGLNEKILQIVKAKSPDILWIDKGLIVKPTTLSQVKKLNSEIIIVSYSPDDILNGWHPRSYFKCSPFYDFHITTNPCNVKDFKQLGANNVLLTNKAYCPSIHKPVSVESHKRAQIGGKVGFIGGFERPRARMLTFLAQNNVRVKVWGDWPKKYIGKVKNLEVMGQPLWGKYYVEAICSFDINLCFFRKRNRDVQNSRGFEIPACGVFMLAERNEYFSKLFKEGKEAEFFDCKEELLEKISYYLTHDQQRKQIAQAGRKRCIEGGYSHKDRLQQLLHKIDRSYIANNVLCGQIVKKGSCYVHKYHSWKVVMKSITDIIESETTSDKSKCYAANR